MYRMQRTQRMSLVPLPQHRHWDSIKIIWLSVTLLSVIAVIYETRYFLLGVDASEHSNDLLLQMPAISSNDDADDDHDSPKQQYLQDVHVDSFPRQLELNDPYKYNANSRAIADKRISPYPPQQVRLNSNDMYYQVQRIEPFVLQKYEQPGLTAKNARMVEEESNEEQGQCVPMGDWQSAIFPTCNTAHEISMQAGKNVEFINCGGDRCAFKLTDNSNEIVLKIPKWKRNFEPSGYSKARLDGVSMERLSQSDYVLDIYAYCGLSQVIELGDGGGNLHDLIKTTRQKIRDELSSIDKLKIGYQLVSAVADMHGNDPATIPIVHNDICCHQFILVNGIYKLNDFHLAKFQKKHVSSGNTCLSTFSYNWGVSTTHRE